MAIVYLNGKFLPAESASISILDRGFIFGDGVYELIPVYGRHVLRLNEHLRRLNDSLTGIYIDNPHSGGEWRDIVMELLRRNEGAEDRAVYLQVTRGAGHRSHVSAAPLPPTIFAMCNPIPARCFESGVSAITHDDIRWSYCNLKVISLVPNVLLRERARRMDGSMEAILVRDGWVTEGAASNVFVVHGERVRTPPKDNSLLPGITRDLVVELLRNSGVDSVEQKISLAELKSADEIWITSSTMGIAPVTRLDGANVGTGEPGAVWRRADALYQAYKLQAVAN